MENWTQSYLKTFCLSHLTSLASTLRRLHGTAHLCNIILIPGTVKTNGLPVFSSNVFGAFALLIITTRWLNTSGTYGLMSSPGHDGNKNTSLPLQLLGEVKVNCAMILLGTDGVLISSSWLVTPKWPIVYRVAQNKIPHLRICNISTTSGLILTKFLKLFNPDTSLSLTVYNVSKTL